LQQAEQLIARHHGPVIFCGDFNTWRAERHALLDQLLAALQLQALGFEDDQRTRVLGRHLDHIYVRGLQAKTAQSFNVASSDHNPMQVVLGLY
jgi:endonuclease/exonuclease/phosphatase (EEP) superfamily protein YafD